MQHAVLVGLILMTTFMFLLWLLHLRLRNAGVVDAGWAAGIAILGLLFAFFGDGPFWRRSLMAIIATLAGGRLAWHITRRLIRDRKEEGRYTTLRESWQTGVAWKFLIFFLFQAILDLVLAIPFLIIAFHLSPTIHPVEIVGLVLWIVGFFGEATADRQLTAFKALPSNQGKICEQGLWYYSRHPNYFFQWLMWLGYAAFALPAPHGWLGLMSPLLMLYFLLRVTGIPPTERQSLKSRGEAYRLYQQSTSAFVPLPKKIKT